MSINFRWIGRMIMFLLCVFALASCKGKENATPDAQELSAAQTKIAFQQQTQQVIQLKTQGRWTADPQASTEQSPTPIAPPLGESTQTQVIPIATITLPRVQTQIISTNTRQATSILILPPTATLQPASTRTQTQAPATPTATRTRTSVPATATATQTQPAQSKWAGEWIIFFEQKDGSYLSGPINITITGTDLTATASLGGDQYSFQGIVYFQVSECATGTWTGPTTSGNFWWSLRSDDQFAGSRENRFGFCGARPASEKPEPCKLLPSR